MHSPGRLLFADQVPEEALEAVLKNRPGLRRPPDVVLLGGAVERAAEERVEAADVVHVQVREEQVVDGLHLAEGQLPQAAVAAIEQELAYRLTAVHGDQQGVVPTGVAQHLIRQTHRTIPPGHPDGPTGSASVSEVCSTSSGLPVKPASRENHPLIDTPGDVRVHPTQPPTYFLEGNSHDRSTSESSRCFPCPSGSLSRRVLRRRTGEREAGTKVVPLWTDKAPGAVGDADEDRPTLTVHLPDPTKATGTGVIVCPGGGYTILVADHEGQQVARWLNSVGIAAFVLKYRLTPRYQRTDALVDGKRALRYVRQHAQEFGISPKRVGIIGFSAGGHLAACTGIDFDDGNAKATDLVERQSSRPDFMVLVYGSTTRVSDPAKKDDPGKTFTAKSPPAFLFSTDGDKATDGLLDLLQCPAKSRRTGRAARLRRLRSARHGIWVPAIRPSVPGPKQLHAWLRKSGLLTTAERQAISGQIMIDGKPSEPGLDHVRPARLPEQAGGLLLHEPPAGGQVRSRCGDGPCVGPHRIEVRQLALEHVDGADAGGRGAVHESNQGRQGRAARYEVKPGENQVKVDIRTK